MSEAEAGSLSVVPRVEVDLVQLPLEVVEKTIAVARPALERGALIDGSLSLDGSSLFVSDPPYNLKEVVSATLRHIGVEDHSGHPTASYNEGTGAWKPGRRMGSIEPNSVWAESKAGIRPKIQEQRQLAKEKTRLAKDHPLGKGGLLLANEFGGIDIEQPELTAHHLVLRAIIIHRAGLHNVEQAVTAGLLDPVLAGLVGEDFANYAKAARTLISGLMLLSDEQKMAAGPAMLQGVVVQAGNFVDAHSKTVETAAHVARDPEAAERALEVVQRGPNLTLSPEL